MVVLCRIAKISLFSPFMETEKNFLFKTQDLYFRNKRKPPRKKIKTATFFPKSDTKVNGSNVFTHCLRDVKSEVLMSSHLVIIASSMLLRRLCVQAFPILLWGPTKRSSAQCFFNGIHNLWVVIFPIKQQPVLCQDIHTCSDSGKNRDNDNRPA